MLILSVDTSQGATSVALAESGRIVGYAGEESPGKQAEMLVLMMESVLAEAGCDYSDIGLLAATVGPGSFTGIRIAIGAMLGLAMVTKITTCGVTTLEAVAHEASLRQPGKPVTALLNAMRGQIYLQHFDIEIQALGEIQLVNLEEINPKTFPEDAIIAGNFHTLFESGALLLPEHSVREAIMPDAKNVALRVTQKAYNAQPLKPLYIRPADAKLPSHTV